MKKSGFSRKIISALVSLTMIASGIYVMPDEVSNVQAAEENTQSAISDVVPASLPDNAIYEITERVSLDVSTATASGSKYWGGFTEEGGICGGALTFAAGVYQNTTSGATTALDPDTYTGTASLVGGECSVYPSETISLEGVTGVLWYVDFSQVEKGGSVDFCTSVPLGCKVDGTNVYYRSNATDAVGYYYQNGTWIKTQNENACRMYVPDNYVGWVYVPLTSYKATSTTAGAIYDENGVGLSGVTVNYMNLYSNGYVKDKDKNILYDEILFVKEFNDVIPPSLPDSSEYEIMERVGLDADTATASGSKYWGDFTEEGGIYGEALTFAAGVYQNTTSGATTALDPDTYTGTASLVGGECSVYPSGTISLEGVTGVLWYVDLSQVEKGGSVDFCTSVPLGCKVDGTNVYYRSNVTDAVGYYYRNGTWIKTQNENACRMYVPDNYVGWVYVPLTSYKATSTTAGAIYDENGVGLSGVTVNYMNLYSNGYVKDKDKNILYDEILFVKEFNDIIPPSLPDSPEYEVTGRVGLDSASEVTGDITGKYSDGQFTTEGAVYGSAYKFACDMTLNDGAGNRGECTLRLNESVAVEGTAGVLWYVDFSDVTADSSKSGIGVTVCLGFTKDDTSYSARSYATGAVGYYYQNGSWISTSPATGYGDRMVIPEGFAGWIYIPYTSYRQSGVLYDAQTGIGLSGAEITSLTLYTEGYVYTADHYTLYDEILFVKKIIFETISADELGMNAYLTATADSTIAAAEALSDGTLKIISGTSGTTTITVTNSYGETMHVTVTVVADGGITTNYTKFVKPENYVNAADYGLSAAATDNAAALQAAMDALPNGGIVYVPKGIYKTSFVQMKEGITLKLEGVLSDYNVPYSDEIASRVNNGEFAVIKASGTYMFMNHEEYAWGRTGADNFGITGGVIDMDGKARGFILSCADNVLLENVIMKDCKNDHAIQITGSTNVTIRNVMFAGYNLVSNYKTAEVIQIEEAQPTSIGSSSAGDNLSNFADYEFYSSGNIVIENCYFGASDEYEAPTFPIGHHGCVGEYCAVGITIKNCTFDSPLACAIRAYGWKDVEISGCSFISEVSSDAITDVIYIFHLSEIKSNI